MDFQDLHAFFHVANEGGFSKAAARLRIAQSALSRRVARLEQMLGVSLLQRHGRGVRLTEQGLALVDRSKALMEELEQIERDILVLAEEPTGKVRIAMPPMVSQVLGPLLVTECRRRFPQIDLQLREGFSDLIQDWIAGDQVDLGILYNSGIDTDLDLSPLLDEPLVLLAPPPGHEGELGTVGDLIDVTQLKDLPLILPSRPNSLRLAVDRVAAQHGLSINIILEVDGVHATKGFVAAGFGYTIFSVNGTDGASDRLCRVIPFRQKLSWRLALAQLPRTRKPRAFDEIERVVREQIGRLLTEGRWQGEMMVDPTE